MRKDDKKKRAIEIVERLKEYYPNAECGLKSGGDPWRLLVMGRLSAQCTDERVNIVCEELFRRFPDASSLADAPLSEIEEIIRPCGIYRAKAYSIKEASRQLIEEFSGVMPHKMEELLRFSGVGRKIANLIIGDVFSLPAIVCDTHCIRICGRLGLYPPNEKDVYKIELALRELIPDDEGADFCHRIVMFGREVCTARAPRCMSCPLADLCRGKDNGKEKN